MGDVRMGEFTTRLGCRIRTIPVTRDDGMDALLALSMEEPDDTRHAEVLVSEADRRMLVEMLGGRF